MRRATRSLCFILIASAVLLPNAPVLGQNEGGPSQAARRTILLVDDHDVLYRSGTKRVLRPLDRHPENPMLPRDKPWEGTLAYCSVYRDAESGRHQLWYQAWTPSQGCRLCYAESTDGIHWVKPNLGLHAYGDSTDTNILMRTGYGASVIMDPRDSDPARRYKAAFWGSGEVDGKSHVGLCVAFSPDGIHWKKHPGNPLIMGSHGNYEQPPFADDPAYESGIKNRPLSISDVIDAQWDPIRECFMVYSKTWLDGPDGTLHWKRAVVRTDSQDFLNWSEPRLVMAADERDGGGGDGKLARTTGGGGSGGVQLHSGPAFCYNGMYFSMLQVMDPDGTGNMPIELALSHEGYDWRRPFRGEWFLPALEDKTRFDASLIWSNATPVFLSTEFRFYYGSYGCAWNSIDAQQVSGIGLATMPRDRFAGVRPVEKIGQITLKAIDRGHWQRLTLNADASQGTIRAEVLDARGYRVRGYTKDDAVSVQGDRLDHAVRWRERQFANLAPGHYRIRLHLENAEVFAVTLSAR